MFGIEFSMSLTEWTVRLGICTLEEALSPEWRNRERGIPRRHVDFDALAAWDFLTHPHAGQFVPTQSRSTHFSDPVLRLVQLYLDYNLIGQTNSAARTSMTELYLLWCVRIGRKVHLGFWTAYQCHLVASHPARNLSICNILGAFVQNNVVIHESEGLSPMFMVDPPGLFDISFFIRTGIVYIREGVPRFYKMGETAPPTGRANVNAGQAEPAEDRTANLERAVADLIEENQEKDKELSKVNANIERLAAMMENFMTKFWEKSAPQEAGTSARTEQEQRPQQPSSAAQEAEVNPGDTQHPAEDASEQPDEGTTKDPKEKAAPGSVPRRSQRKK